MLAAFENMKKAEERKAEIRPTANLRRTKSLDSLPPTEFCPNEPTTDCCGGGGGRRRKKTSHTAI